MTKLKEVFQLNHPKAGKIYIGLITDEKSKSNFLIDEDDKLVFLFKYSPDFHENWEKVIKACKERDSETLASIESIFASDMEGKINDQTFYSWLLNAVKMNTPSTTGGNA